MKTPRHSSSVLTKADEGDVRELMAKHPLWDETYAMRMVAMTKFRKIMSMLARREISLDDAMLIRSGKKDFQKE